MGVGGKWILASCFIVEPRLSLLPLAFLVFIRTSSVVCLAKGAETMKRNVITTSRKAIGWVFFDAVRLNAVGLLVDGGQVLVSTLEMSYLYDY